MSILQYAPILNQKPSFKLWAAQTKLGLDALEASSALHAWVPDLSVTTLNAGNISAIADSWGASSMSQGTAGTQPAYSATAGPNGRPAVTGMVSRFLVASVSYASGNRIGWYVVGKRGDTNSRHFFVAVDDPTTISAVRFGRRATDGVFNNVLTLETGGEQSLTITAPAVDDLWHVFAARPLASGALSQIDGVTTTPNFTGTDGAGEIELVYIGHPSLPRGSVSGVFAVDNPTDAKDTYLRSRIAMWFGTLPQ